jgi:hypothetical protein
VVLVTKDKAVMSTAKLGYIVLAGKTSLELVTGEREDEPRAGLLWISQRATLFPTYQQARAARERTERWRHSKGYAALPKMRTVPVYERD